MKIMTVLGTRPEIIRLSIIIQKLDRHCDHVLVHTGQNYVETLNDIFFKELSIRTPNYSLGIRAGSFGEQIGKIIVETERLIGQEKPDRLLILGDTNSGLSVIPGKRLGVSVFHMEAGNRCYDDRVPEEINRRIIDHTSDVLMPYTHRSKENLVREGIGRERIFVIGNPINEVMTHYSSLIAKSNILERLKVKGKKYFAVTMHRAENVDNEPRLNQLVRSLELLAQEFKLPVVCSLHPRTKDRMQKYGLSFEHEFITYVEPVGFFDFVTLETNALCVISDSGTVQEECCILRVPNVTIRDVTERPETVECGSNILASVDPGTILRTVKMILDRATNWPIPPEYTDPLVSDKVLKILLGYHGG
jgi:UDP-N-acetylglucosamine 2-epimerase (non-hydrolysing)